MSDNCAGIDDILRKPDFGESHWERLFEDLEGFSPGDLRVVRFQEIQNRTTSSNPTRKIYRKFEFTFARHVVRRSILWADFLSYSAEMPRIPAVVSANGTAENQRAPPVGQIGAIFSSPRFAGPLRDIADICQIN
jgi:hypothetical protein